MKDCKWAARQMAGETCSDFYERIESGIMTWNRRNYGADPKKIKRIEEVPSWATQITTYKLQVIQYSGMHPENGLTVIVI